MEYDPEVHHRRSIRLRDFDYSNVGAYYVTICAWQRECLFGEVVDGEVRLNTVGEIVQEEWQLTAAVRENVRLDEFIVMPNHFHAIIFINDCRGTACRALGVNGGTDRDHAVPLRWNRLVIRWLGHCRPSSVHSNTPPPNASTNNATTPALRSGNAIITNGSSVTRRNCMPFVNI